MAKAVKANLKMKIKGGQASAAPPVGSTLGQYGVNMMDFIGPFNDATKDMQGATVTARQHLAGAQVARQHLGPARRGRAVEGDGQHAVLDRPAPLHA